jgi:uncharacterized protein
MEDDSLYRATQAARPRPPSQRGAPRPGAGPGVFIVGALAVAIVTFAVLAGPGPSGRDAAKDGVQTPIVKAPAEPFKSAYSGPQKVEEPPPEREIFAKIDPAKPAGPPVKAEPPAASPPKAAPAPAPTQTQTPAPTPAPAPSAAKAGFAASGPYQVQLGAFGAQGSARAAFAALQKRAPALTGGANLDVQSVSGPTGAVLHRLRLGFFPDRASADAFCAQMRAMDQQCMAVAR